MTINDLTIKDILVGEVWVGSGQSNMEFVLNNAVNHDEEIARASYPLIHLFHVKHWSPSNRPTTLSGVGTSARRRRFRASPRSNIFSAAICTRNCMCPWD